MSKEGLLGVEGIDEKTVIDALIKSGCTIAGESGGKRTEGGITKADLYAMGLSGKEDSAELRRRLLCEMGFPSKLSSNMLLDAINRLMNKEELLEMIEHMKASEI